MGYLAREFSIDPIDFEAERCKGLTRRGAL
jgi:hypothetical protein